MKSIVVTVLLITTSVQSRQGFGPGEQEWGYVHLRNNTRMFWWLFETTANVSDYTEKPLIIWLQGGPGVSATGLGNFGELGPVDIDLNPRNTTWVNDYNILFVDSPVGTGFSSVDKDIDLTNSNEQIADDFLEFLKEFYRIIPDLQRTPLYLFAESYGGKMAVEIAVVIDQAIKRGDLNIKLIGIGLGDSWISGVDIVSAWGSYLFHLGFVDRAGYESIQDIINTIEALVDDEKWIEATNTWAVLETFILQSVNKIDFYNVLNKVKVTNSRSVVSRLFTPDSEQLSLLSVMERVKETLGLDTDWVGQNNIVFQHNQEEFMKPVTHIVEQILNTTDIKIAVFNGQLDLIVATPGVVKWVDKLKFNGSEAWRSSDRRPIVVDGTIEGYYKKLGNLSMYWVYRAGHMVPKDNPAAMRYVLRDFVQEKN